MADRTRIAWTQATWNPLHGCTKVSPGCKHCYAERMARRLHGRVGYPDDEPFRLTLAPERLEEPLRWREPRLVFVCSMGDLFHKDVPHDYIRKVFTVMAWDAPQHTYQVLTKRPERMRDFAVWWVRQNGEMLPANIWLGVSAERQQEADERIPLLLEAPAAVRWVSAEPLLGPLDLHEWLAVENLKGLWTPGVDWWTEKTGEVSQLHWVVAGSETGPGARPAELDWFRSLRSQCHAASVPLFVKQVGNRPGKDTTLDGAEHREWPEREG